MTFERGAKGSRNRRIPGFTLIELLIVIVVLGILAAIAIPRFMRARENSQLASVKSDLRNLSSQQEIYHSNNQMYASNLADLNVNVSEGVTVTINEADGTGWAATGVHASLVEQCGIYYGSASPSNGAPASTAGTVECGTP